MSSKLSSSEKIYQIKVTLRDSTPPIWRQLLLSGETSLYDLHRIIQVAMGWTNSHLHQFIVGDKYYAIPSEDDWQPVKDEQNYSIAEIAPKEKDKLIYEYDFGDSWEHEILVERILPGEPEGLYPRCLEGKRACPPEDVGGTEMFKEFLEAMRDPTHEEHDEYVEWWGGIFDPEKIDVKAINEMLNNIDQMEWWDFE